MPDLTFTIQKSGVMADSLTPQIAFDLHILNRPSEQQIHAILLRCQVQIETPRRRYTAAETERLRNLFGEPERWAQTLRPLLWANLSVTVPAFTGETSVTLPVPCTFDLAVSATKYFYVMEGEVPLAFLFSGTAFYRANECWQAAPISWNSEARHKFPTALWKESIDRHYGNTGWLPIRRDLFEKLYRFQTDQGLSTVDEAMERLLAASSEEVLR